MVAIAIRYLMGWSMATNSADRERPEWPPHPDRVFMALAAAYYETDGDDSEWEALIWLERQGAPNMWASDATQRETMTTYVPVNDSAPLSRRPGRQLSAQQVRAGLQLLPENRSRQPRQFPVVIPHDPKVYLVWQETPSAEVRAGLESLCGKVIRVGHSASLVQAWVEDAPPEPNLAPTAGVAQHPLRVPGLGRLEHLTAQYQRGAQTRTLTMGCLRPSATGKPAEAPGAASSMTSYWCCAGWTVGGWDWRALSYWPTNSAMQWSSTVPIRSRNGLADTLPAAGHHRNRTSAFCPFPS